jgi:hypothetical protein
MSKRGKEANGPNLRKHEDLIHPIRKITSQREDARNIITQARVNRSHYEWDEGNYEDEEK